MSGRRAMTQTGDHVTADDYDHLRISREEILLEPSGRYEEVDLRHFKKLPAKLHPSCTGCAEAGEAKACTGPPACLQCWSVGHTCEWPDSTTTKQARSTKPQPSRSSVVAANAAARAAKHEIATAAALAAGRSPPPPPKRPGRRSRVTTTVDGEDDAPTASATGPPPRRPRGRPPKPRPINIESSSQLKPTEAVPLKLAVKVTLQARDETEPANKKRKMSNARSVTDGMDVEMF